MNGSNARSYTILTLLITAAVARAQEQPPVLRQPLEPPVLRRPLEPTPLPPAPAELLAPEGLLQTPVDPPLGYTGPSGIRPRDIQETSDFVPMEDRWRLGLPE